MKKLPLANPAFLTAFVVLTISAIGLAYSVQAMGVHLQKKPIHPESGLKFHTLPREFRGWEQFGDDPPPLSKEVLEELGTENYLSRWYIETDVPEGNTPDRVELHCAYYTGTIDTVPHVPERCYVGGGMRIDGDSVVVDIPLDLSRFPRDPMLAGTPYESMRRGRTGPTSKQPGVYVTMPRGVEKLRMSVTPFIDARGRKLFAGYFFLANGGTVPTADGVRLLAFKLKDSYAYYTKIQFMSDTVDSPKELAAVAADVLNEIFPEIMRRTPNWIDVEEGRWPLDDPEEDATPRALRAVPDPTSTRRPADTSLAAASRRDWHEKR